MQEKREREAILVGTSYILAIKVLYFYIEMLNHSSIIKKKVESIWPINAYFIYL